MDETTNNETGMVLRTEGLVKRYGKRTVVNDVSINVRQGELVAVLGHNGSGKSTFAKNLNSILLPQGGV